MSHATFIRRHRTPHIFLTEISDAICVVYGISTFDFFSSPLFKLHRGMCLWLIHMKTKANQEAISDYFNHIGIQEVVNLKARYRQHLRKNKKAFRELEKVLDLIG